MLTKILHIRANMVLSKTKVIGYATCVTPDELRNCDLRMLERQYGWRLGPILKAAKQALEDEEKTR